MALVSKHRGMVQYFPGLSRQKSQVFGPQIHPSDSQEMVFNGPQGAVWLQLRK